MAIFRESHAGDLIADESTRPGWHNMSGWKSLIRNAPNICHAGNAPSGDTQPFFYPAEITTGFPRLSADTKRNALDWARPRC
jgi:hypothetical protein